MRAEFIDPVLPGYALALAVDQDLVRAAVVLGERRGRAAYSIEEGTVEAHHAIVANVVVASQTAAGDSTPLRAGLTQLPHRYTLAIEWTYNKTHIALSIHTALTSIPA